MPGGLRLGGSTDLIVLGPLGGLHSPHVPREPHREVAVAMAGPAANFVVMTILGPPLLLIGKVNLGIDFTGTAASRSSTDNRSVSCGNGTEIGLLAQLATGLSESTSSRANGRRPSTAQHIVAGDGLSRTLRTLSRSGMLVSLVLCLVALLVHEPSEHRLVPIWLPLVLLAVYLYFSARRESQRGDDEAGDDDLFGYDFSQGYTSLERPTRAPKSPRPTAPLVGTAPPNPPAPVREMEAEEERRVDEVLIRIKQFGKESLTSEEQSLLERVSARYRNRLQS